MTRSAWLFEAGWVRSLSALAVIATSSAVLLASPAALRSSPERQVTIDNFAFSPGTVTVAPGTEVTWTNEDDIPHTIVLMDGSARSKALDSDDKFSHRFDKVGTYAYICSLHPHMHGEIVVR